MDGRLGSQARGRILEVRNDPTFRQLLARDTAGSRLLESEPISNDNPNAPIEYSAAASQLHDAAVSQSRPATPKGKMHLHTSYESVDTVDRIEPESNARKYWRGPSTYTLTWEVLGVVISVLFLILGALVANLRGRNESDWSKQIVQATQIAPSIWPILFSGILGNAVRQFANWRVERGIRLLLLEQLMSSLTMAGSLISIFTWSILQSSSLILILLWAFNPLGSQASFRGIYLTEALGNGTGTITHYNPNTTVQVALSAFQGGSTRAYPMVRGLYLAALYDVTSNIQYVDNDNATFQDRIMTLGGPSAAGVQAAMDSWGSVRIPTVDHLSEYDPDHPYEWIEVPWRDQLQNYSSLVGDRLDGLDRSFTGNTTFNMTSSYQHFNCSPWLIMDDKEAEAWTMGTFGQNFSEFYAADLSRAGPGPLEGDVYRTFWGLSSSVQGTYWNLTAPGHPKFIFASLASGDGSGKLLYVTTCETGTTYVDAQVSCMSKGASGKAICGVDAIRKSSNGPGFLEALRYEQRNLTVGFDEFVARNFLAAFTDMLDDNQEGSGKQSLVERFIYDPMSAFDGTLGFQHAILAEVDVKLVEKRLGLLYNTLWKAAWSYSSMTGGNMRVPFNSSDTGTFADDIVPTLSNTTSHTTQPLPPVYALDLPWLMLYFVSVGIMFLAAVASLVLHVRCTAPPILGYVSSLIRDSVFFGEAGVQGNSIEGSASRTKRLKNMEVKVADVWSTESVGRVAFAPAQGRGAVKKDRWYD